MTMYLGMTIEMPLGRYGGCFEENIMRLMGERECIISRDLDALAKVVPTLKMRKVNAWYRRG